MDQGNLSVREFFGLNKEDFKMKEDYNSRTNSYVWYSQRGFSNEGTIYVVPQNRVEELFLAISELKNYNEVNSNVMKITRKQAEKDKDFLATNNSYVEENTVEYRINLAREATREVFGI